MIDFSSLDSIKKYGFTGFVSFCKLESTKEIPTSNGVYMVLLREVSKPDFLIKGSGGYYSGREPNISIDELEKQWVDNSLVMYIGKAKNIKKRLLIYQKFGEGKPVAHYGGRHIWQIRNAMNDLVICWKITPCEDHDTIESDLISDFRVQYGVRPFANLNK